MREDNRKKGPIRGGGPILGEGDLSVESLLFRLEELAGHGDLPDPDTTTGKLTREFFKHNWENTQGLLGKTKKIRLFPESSEAPHRFRFEVDLPFKSKRTPTGPVELRPGPVRGTLRYRPDVITADPDEPSIVVCLDADQAYYHPNFSRQRGVLCDGAIARGTFPLDAYLVHLYSILSYGNRSSRSPADREAALYFVENAAAMSGLEPVAPLY